MGILVDSLLGEMQDLYDQPYVFLYSDSIELSTLGIWEVRE